MVMTSAKVKIQLAYSYCCLRVGIVLKWEVRKKLNLGVAWKRWKRVIVCCL